ncbi:MAG: transposase [Phascolarctobacterium sp.]|nr:transposase [Phascolarctobacterium sp.]
MRRHFFTEEQQNILRNNPYVYKVTDVTLRVTQEFKQIFLEAYNNGERAREIFDKHGFTKDLVSDGRLWSMADHIRNEYAKYGDVRDGNNPRSSEEKPKKVLSKEDEIDKLRTEVEYLRQEIEFLKKITSLAKSRK